MGNGTSTIKQGSGSEGRGSDAMGLGLSTSDMDLVRTSWRSIENHKRLGEDIFLMLFKQYPHIKKSFHFKDISLDELKQLPRFAEHAANFTAFLHVVVNALPDEEKILKVASAIGTKHAMMSMFDSTLFDPSYWISFAFISATKIAEKTKDGVSKGREQVRKTWQVLLFRLIIQMQVRFYKDLLSTNGSVLVSKDQETAEDMLRDEKNAILKNTT